jgi:hypothetical protein
VSSWPHDPPETLNVTIAEAVVAHLERQGEYYVLTSVTWDTPYCELERGKSAIDALSYLFGAEGVVPAVLHQKLWPLTCPMQGEELGSLLAVWVAEEAEDQINDACADEMLEYGALDIKGYTDALLELRKIARGEVA